MLGRRVNALGFGEPHPSSRAPSQHRIPSQRQSSCSWVRQCKWFLFSFDVCVLVIIDLSFFFFFFFFPFFIWTVFYFIFLVILAIGFDEQTIKATVGCALWWCTYVQCQLYACTFLWLYVVLVRLYATFQHSSVLSVYLALAFCCSVRLTGYRLINWNEPSKMDCGNKSSKQ